MQFIEQFLNKIKTEQNVENERLSPPNKNYAAHLLTINQFHPIASNLNENKSNESKLNKSTNSKLACIDGGNAEILRAPDFSLQLIRLCAVVMQNNKTISLQRFEFYAAITSFAENDEIKFKVEYFGDNLDKEILPNEKHVTFNSFDRTIISGTERAEISKMGDVIRKFAELSLAKKIAKQLVSKDILLLDNSLKCYFTNEQLYWQQLFEEINKKDIILAAIIKTTSMLTQSGKSIITVLQLLSKQIQLGNNCWYYYPVISFNNLLNDSEKNEKNDYPAEILFAKLHAHAQNIFRVEIFNKSYSQDNLTLLLSTLLQQSNDAVFLGYPYCLVQADAFARVSNKEKDYLRVISLSKAGKNNDASDALKYSVSALNAHDGLDKK